MTPPPSRRREPYTRRDVIKSFPGRRWHPEARHWTVPVEMIDPLAAELRAEGGQVFVTDADGKPYGRRAGAPPGRWCAMTELHIPGQGPDVDMLTAALAYAEAGWYVVPVEMGTKNAGSVLGKGWQHQSSRDPQLITAWPAGRDHGVALHCGRSGAVVFDVDDPDQLPAEPAELLPDSTDTADAATDDQVAGFRPSTRAPTGPSCWRRCCGSSTGGSRPASRGTTRRLS